MTLIVLVLLASAWLGYFALWFRERRAARPVRNGGMVGFSQSFNDTSRMQALPGGFGTAAKPRGEFFEVPRSPQQALSRRRQVVAVLATVALASLLAVPVVGVSVLAVHVVADVALLLFSFGAVRRQQVMVPSVAEVRVLYPQRLPPASVASPLRQVVNG